MTSIGSYSGGSQEQPAPTESEVVVPASSVDMTVTPAATPPQLRVEPVRARPSSPKWETDARARLRAGIQKFQKPLQDLANRDANEGDTRLLITDFLCEALGYDKFSDLTTEYQVKGEFADYGIRMDNDLIAFIEAKRIKTALSVRHLRQVEMYAVNEGVEWTILTNGATWQVYHIGAGLPVQIDLALDVDLLGPATAAQKAAELFYLTKESIKRQQINELWQAKSAMSGRSLAGILTTSAVLEVVRRELRKKTGHRANDAELATLLRETVIRSDVL